MNLFPYLPPLVSIYLLSMSGVSTSYFKNKLSHFVERKRKLKDHRQIIENVALDWSARLSFINSMLVSLVSVFSIFSNTKDYVAAGTILSVLLIIFFWLGWWVH